MQIVKYLLKSVNLCKFIAWSSDVLPDKPHPRFDTKILEQKGAAYMPVFTVTGFALLIYKGQHT